MPRNIWEALNGLTPQEKAPEQGNFSGRLQSLIQARTGKAATGAPAQTSLAEQQTALAGGAEVQAQLGQVAGQEQILARQGAEVEKGKELGLEQVQSQRALGKQKVRSQVDQMLSESARNRQALSTEKQAQILEQAAFTYALTNDRYVNNLQNEAAKRRLDNQLQFDSALQAAIYGDYIDLINSNLKVRRMIDEKNRSAADEISAMDIATAMQILESGIQSSIMQRNYATMAQAGSGLLQGASKYYERTDTQPKAGASAGGVYQFGAADDYGTGLGGVK